MRAHTGSISKALAALALLVASVAVPALAVEVGALDALGFGPTVQAPATPAGEVVVASGSAPARRRPVVQIRRSVAKRVSAVPIAVQVTPAGEHATCCAARVRSDVRTQDGAAPGAGRTAHARKAGDAEHAVDADHTGAHHADRSLRAADQHHDTSGSRRHAAGRGAADLHAAGDPAGRHRAAAQPAAVRGGTHRALPQTITVPPIIKTVGSLARHFGINAPPPPFELGKDDEAGDEASEDAPTDAQTDVSWPAPASPRLGR